jgi:hypothetical protein
LNMALVKMPFVLNTKVTVVSQQPKPSDKYTHSSDSFDAFPSKVSTNTTNMATRMTVPAASKQWMILLIVASLMLLVNCASQRGLRTSSNIVMMRRLENDTGTTFFARVAETFRRYPSHASILFSFFLTFTQTSSTRPIQKKPQTMRCPVRVGNDDE